jgi:hypothetical protein
LLAESYSRRDVSELKVVSPVGWRNGGVEGNKEEKGCFARMPLSPRSEVEISGCPEAISDRDCP